MSENARGGKIVITGANGMVGSSLVDRLAGRFELVLVDVVTGRIESLGDSNRVLKASCLCVDEWESALENAYCVVHLAALVHRTAGTSGESDQYIATNVEATRMLYEACVRQRVRRFLFFSTNDVYRPSRELATEETPTEPRGPYARSKLIAEQHLWEASRDVGTAVCVFRPASIYGENDTGSMRSLVLLCRKGVVPMIGRGNTPKALLYVKDAAQAVERYIVSQRDHRGEVFNICSGTHTYREIIDTICEVYRLAPLRVCVPEWFCRRIAPRIRPLSKLATAAQARVISGCKAARLLGYKPEYSLAEGLTDSIDYYLQP
jgi:nucleoside-diphosphate-sugar epimerase